MFGIRPRWLQSMVFASEGRSPHWHRIREEFIKLFPSCAVCGGTKHLEAHHIRPFHLHPELELDMDNLITLCRKSEVLGVVIVILCLGMRGRGRLSYPT